MPVPEKTSTPAKTPPPRSFSRNPTDTEGRRGGALRRWIVPSGGKLLIVSLVLLAGLLLYPVRNQITRAGILAAAAGADIALLMVLAKRRRMLWTVLAPQALILLFLILPGREPDANRLRSAHVSALMRFAGTRYVWGGETHLGVDCSGLLRAALVEANALQSIRTLNPALLRTALWLWWNDASAREMSNGYSGNTIAIARPNPMAEAATSMQPGDFAVTSDGSHVLAYIGNSQWIEADPYVNRVIFLRPGEPSAWWNMQVLPGRWKSLDSPAK